MLQSQKTKYDLRFKKFLRRINDISKLEPREKYLYCIMDGVPFKDLEIALIMAKIEYNKAVNDNKGRG